MARGSLTCQLRADLSVRDARKDDTPGAIAERIERLRRAIRAVELEQA